MKKIYLRNNYIIVEDNGNTKNFPQSCIMEEESDTFFIEVGSKKHTISKSDLVNYFDEAGSVPYTESSLRDFLEVNTGFSRASGSDVSNSQPSVSVQCFENTLYTSSNKFTPAVSMNLTDNLSVNLSSIASTNSANFIGSDVIAGIDSQAVYEFHAAMDVDNSVGQITLYFELIDANGNVFSQNSFVTNKVTEPTPKNISFNFNGADAQNGFTFNIYGHKGSSGTDIYNIKMTLKEFK